MSGVWRSLGARDTAVQERMDDPSADRHMLERTYARFGLVNTLVSGWRSTYVNVIRPHLRAGEINRLLDVGTGGADLPRAVLRWAKRDGLILEVTAIDPDERAFEWASAQQPVDGLTLRAVYTSDLVRSGEQFDVVVSNHVLHHLTDDEVLRLLDDSERLTGVDGIAVHGDIARSRFAYAAFGAATWPFAATLLRKSFIRDDGLVSIRRSRTADEFTRMVPEGWRVIGAFPSRLEVRWNVGNA